MQQQQFFDILVSQTPQRKWYKGQISIIKHTRTKRQLDQSTHQGEENSHLRCPSHLSDSRETVCNVSFYSGVSSKSGGVV
jgi:demethoxyubiquinone hydroxylase (CLK1/Coq7/Cat5 family)